MGKKLWFQETEYLVKWKGYSSFDVTWEPANHLPPEVINEFYHPTLSDQELQGASDIFLTAVKWRLSQRTGQHFYVELSHRIFIYLFGECKKGLFSCKSFCKFLLPADWVLFVYTKNGEGRRNDFPVSIVPIVKWSKKHFVRDEKTGEYLEGKRRLLEKFGMDKSNWKWYEESSTATSFEITKLSKNPLPTLKQQ